MRAAVHEPREPDADGGDAALRFGVVRQFADERRELAKEVVGALALGVDAELAEERSRCVDEARTVVPPRSTPI